MKFESRALGCALRLALPVFTLPAMAVAADASVENTGAGVAALPAITVSSDKVERPIEQVPASVAVIDGVELEQSGITSMEQLEGRVAGLSFQPFGQPGMKAPVMRGLTASIHSFSTSVLMLVDGVPTLTAQGYENSFLDLDRIEVLRGPQSTLYGRNAESGVISFYTQPMDNTPRASVTADLGNHDRRAMRFSLSQPLVEDTLYASLSGSWLKQGGFIRNTYSGGKEDKRDHKDLNLGLRWTPSAATDVVLRYVRQDYDDGAALWGNVGTPRAEVESGTPSWNRSLGQTVSLNASHVLASGLRLRSITAYNHFRDKIQQDTDFMPVETLYIGRDNKLGTWSQEFRMEGNLGRADWLVGVYGDQSDNNLRNFTKRGPMFLNYRAKLKTQSLALFTNWNVPLDDAWSVSAGGRIERNSAEVRPDSGVRKKEDWTHFSPKLALQYQINPEHQWYASVSRGIRAGGYNIFVSALDYPSYDPEENWSYETGLKGWALEKRLRYSMAAYIMKVDNMQVQMQPAPGVIYTASAARATSKGLELDMDYLLGSNWRLTGGMAWNRTTFDSFEDGAANYAGNDNNFAPRMTGHVGVRYDAPQGWYAQASLVGSSKIYLDAANQYRRNGYGLVNLVAGYQRGDWEIAAYVNNLADKTYDAAGYQGGYVTIYSPPREIGARLTWRM
ncbi:TonB-dependent receptor [Kerstersia similis]|uniref:TonB-dependent receptor n=1 Tax=Kerstersia similis TaxID=206505 RepID=UPI0039EE88B8